MLTLLTTTPFIEDQKSEISVAITNLNTKPDTFRNSDIINSIIDDDLYEKFEADVMASNNQNGNVEWK